MVNKKFSEQNRRVTREILVGSVGVGGTNPVRIQSMTTSDTRDVEATIEQIIRLADEGCEIARVTVQGMKEAHACEGIKNGLIQRGYTIPIVADIHFYPPAAMTVVEYVDKVRINPGNFVDRRASFKVLEYDDASYQNELNRLEDKFTPLVLKCKRLDRAMRIGTNHGSLSDRVLNRFGDTPAGMVESALEFAKVCRKNDFHSFIFSMKASNTRIMIEAYRLLAQQMDELGWDYPFHLGVTEAGEGEDGRVKSAIGIGTLLLDGIGETMRVSLTEDPWQEIDTCKRLVNLAQKYRTSLQLPKEGEFSSLVAKDEEASVKVVEGPSFLHRDGTVILSVSAEEFLSDDFFGGLGCGREESLPVKEIDTADAVWIREPVEFSQVEERLKLLVKMGVGILSSFPLKGVAQVYSINEALEKSAESNRSLLAMHETTYVLVDNGSPNEWESLLKIQPSLVLLGFTEDRVNRSREFVNWMHRSGVEYPVMLSFDYSEGKEDLILRSSAEMGSLLCDQLASGVVLSASGMKPGLVRMVFVRSLAFNILQGSRMRAVKTEFISCPSCGRTLFDLQEVAARIRSRTSHLPGVKIAIMGCIVNGPGEMADADFGYVGSRPGKVDLYVGKSCVEKGIDFDEADDRLVELIKSHGRWVEDPSLSEELL